MATANTTVSATDPSFEMSCGVPESLKFKPENCRETEHLIIASESTTKTIPIIPLKSKELVEEDINISFSSGKSLIHAIQSVNKSAELLNTGLNNCNVLLLDIKEAFEILADYLNHTSPAEEELVEALTSLIEYNELIHAWITTENFFLEIIKGAFGTISNELVLLSTLDKDLVDSLGSLNSSIKLILSGQKTQKSLIVEIQGASPTIFEKLYINYSAVQELVDTLKSHDASIDQIAEEMSHKTFLVEMNALLDSILSQQISLETRLSNLDITGFTDIKNPSIGVQQQTSYETIFKLSQSRDAVLTNLKIHDTEEKNS